MGTYSIFHRKPVTIEEEFEKNPELTHEAMRILKEWYETKPHFPKISDERLALFYHGCRWNLEQTKVALESNLELRSKWHEVFAHRDPFLITNHGSAHIFLLPQMTKQGNRVICMKKTHADLSLFSLDECLKLIWMTADILDYYEGTNKGLILIMDCSDLPFGILRKLSFSSLRKAIHLMDYCMPVRMKELHFVKINAVIHRFLSIVSPFLKGGYEETMHLHLEPETLQEFIPKEILPIEYGGPELTISQMAAMTEELRQRSKNWYEFEETLRIDKSKRPNEPKGGFFKWLGF